MIPLDSVAALEMVSWILVLVQPRSRELLLRAETYRTTVARTRSLVL